MGYYSQVAVRFKHPDAERHPRYRQLLESFTIEEDDWFKSRHEELTKDLPESYPHPAFLLTVFHLYGFNIFLDRDNITVATDYTRFCLETSKGGVAFCELMDALDAEGYEDFYAYYSIGQEGEELRRGAHDRHFYPIREIELNLPPGHCQYHYGYKLVTGPTSGTKLEAVLESRTPP